MVKSTFFILVGTKSDLRNDFETLQTLESKSQKPITYYQGMSLAQEIGAIKYLECSALTHERVDEIFQKAIQTVLKKNLQKNKQSSRTCIIH